VHASVIDRVKRALHVKQCHGRAFYVHGSTRTDRNVAGLTNLNEICHSKIPSLAHQMTHFLSQLGSGFKSERVAVMRRMDRWEARLAMLLSLYSRREQQRTPRDC